MKVLNFLIFSVLTLFTIPASVFSLENENTVSTSGEVECYQPGCSDFDYYTCMDYPNDCVYVDFKGCVDKRDLGDSVTPVPVEYDWRHSAFACCPAAIKDGLECGLDPLCILAEIIKNKCPQKCEADLCHNVPSTCNHRLDQVDVNCDNLNREQCFEHPKECMYIGCSYGCPGCIFRNETTGISEVGKVDGILSCGDKLYEALKCGDDVPCLVIKLGETIADCATYICPKLSGFLMKFSPLCQIYCEHHHCASHLEEDVAENNLLGSIQSSIQHATSDYWGRSTSAGPDGGVEACAWAVNNIISDAGYRKVGDNPNYVPSVVDAIKAGRGRQIQASQAVPGDLVVACGEQHIGICMENNCNTIDSNSSSRRCFCWRSGFNFDNYFGCGPATYWRLEN